MMRRFSTAELKERALHRVARVIHGLSEEGRGLHSRIFEVLVPDELVICGQSVKGGGYREHIVPCALIRDECMKMYQRGASHEEVVLMLDRHLSIALITPEEAAHLDHELGLKTTMPVGWRFGVDDPFARLQAAEIDLRPLASSS